MQYSIIQTKDVQRLADLVNQHIAEGWIPQGGLSVAGDQGYWVWCQAMIRLKD